MLYYFIEETPRARVIGCLGRMSIALFLYMQDFILDAITCQ